MWRSRRTHLFALALMVACDPPTTAAPPGPLVIIEPTVSWFEPVLLADDDRWSCVGIVDLEHDGSDEIVLVAPSRIRVLDASGANGSDTPIVPSLDGPPLGCDAADLDHDGNLELVLADGRGGVVARWSDGAWELAPLPALEDPEGAAVTFALALLDADGDGSHDAYVARSITGSASTFIVDGCREVGDGDFLCGAPDRTYAGTPNVLLHGSPDGTFVVAPGPGAEDPWQSQAIGVLDVDRDGRQDLVVANDAMENRIYLSRGALRFEDATERYGLTRRNHGMSVLAGDLDGDGEVDLAFSDIGPPFVVRRDGASFVPLGLAAGFAPVAQWAWGAAMEDFDADGDLDLLFANSGLELESLSLYCAGECGFDEWPREELLFYRNDGRARFDAERAVPAASSPFASNRRFVGAHALAVGDLDRDGVLDAVVTRRARVDGPREAWLLRGRTMRGRGVSVEAPQGAIVQACAADVCRAREVLGGHGFGAISARRVFLGIGTAGEARITITWGGVEHELGTVEAGALARFDPNRLR